MGLPAYSANFTRLIADCNSAFHDLSAGDWTWSRGPGKWTRLEILGHLIDSAVNNHQRFVRALAQDELVWPSYDQEAMVRVQQWGTMPHFLLVNLWGSLNLYLARLISLVPQDKLDTPCTIGSDNTTTLQALITGYADHLEHHLRQIFENTNCTVRWMP